MEETYEGWPPEVAAAVAEVQATWTIEDRLQRGRLKLDRAKTVRRRFDERDEDTKPKHHKRRRKHADV